ncbi:MAG: tRNA lysidine(34) synthetase TilS [Reyranella sp.]|nr:tRNA lysidine(34) synthetase TilS [Reyranella sp.]
MTAREARPLAPGAFARLMQPFEPFEPHAVVAVAVSGGRDSLALALLARDWAAARGGQAVALIVDHGLRAESGTEAMAACDVLKGLGIEAEILRWSGVKPGTGLQAAARRARYRLLGEACRRRGILHLLLAHHADDQAETVTMRAARRSGADGLAGMAALVERADVRLLRPLLGLPRAVLTATLLARGVTWIDDPSNDDVRFERVRLRKAASDPAVLLPGAGAARAVLERRLSQAAVEVLEVDDAGATAVDWAGFCELEADLQARLLSRVVQAVGGRDHPPHRDRLAGATRRVVAGAARGKSGKGQDFTVSACRLMLRQAPVGHRLRWIVRPESGRKASQPLVPAEFFACGGPAATHVD